MEALEETPKRRRGRPKGSLNKATIARMSEPEEALEEAPEEVPEEEAEAPEEAEVLEVPEVPDPPTKRRARKVAIAAPPEPPGPPSSPKPALSTKRARKVTMAPASTPELTSGTFLEHLTKGLRSARELEASRRNSQYESFFQGFPMKS